MGYSSGGGSSSSSISIPPLGPGGTKRLAKKMVETSSPFIFGGDTTSPMIRMLSNLTYEAGAKEANLERGRILGTKGMSQPAKAKTVQSLSDKVIQAAAGVPSQLYLKLREELANLLQPTQISQSSTEGTTHSAL